MSQIQIAIDGPAASGKSTVAKKLAAKLGGFYVNTGDMYRALTMLILQHGIKISADVAACDVVAIEKIMKDFNIYYQGNEKTGELTLMINNQVADHQAVRSPEVAAFVSQVAAIPEVRQWMLTRQRASASLGLIIMEGRDIGTVIFPQAAHKFFVTASPEERARRRLAQPGETIDGATLQAVAAEIAKRDKMDSERAISPLRPASDALIVDTTSMTIDEVIEFLANKIKP